MDKPTELHLLRKNDASLFRRMHRRNKTKLNRTALVHKLEGLLSSAGSRFRDPADFWDVFLYFSRQGCYTCPYEPDRPGTTRAEKPGKGGEGA